MSDVYLDVRDVASYLKISVRKVFNLRTDRELPPAVLVGRTPRWRKSEIDSFLSNRREY